MTRTLTAIVDRLAIENAYLVSLERSTDERGYMERLVRSDGWRYVSYVMNPTRGTLRGLHFQQEPYGENKMIWCASGSVFDVLIDTRDDSPTKREQVTIEMKAGDNKMI